MPAHFEFSADASLRSRQWLESAQPGFCGYTVDRQRNLCSRDSYGSFGLSEAASTSSVRAVAVCLKHCDSCERCNFITVNPGERDCSWYHTCNTSKLLQHYPGFLSGAVSTAGKKAVAESLKLPSQPVVQNVVLFIHMEKTGGTLVRNLFARGNWSSTGYCKRTEDVIPDVQRALLAGTRKIFVEHHCSLNWKLPGLLTNMISDLNQKGLRVRYRSFTLLRSPSALTYSQFNYWQHHKFLSLDLYTQLASEMLLFRDPMKLIECNGRGMVGRATNFNETGGVFLNLWLTPLPNRSMLCGSSKWNETCARIVADFAKSDPDGTTNQRRRRLLRGDSDGRELSVYEEGAEILVRHAERVQRTVRKRGCESLLAEAAERLSTLSHVFFLEASVFSVEHIGNMAMGDASVNSGIAPVNQAKGHISTPYHEQEALKYNTCAEYVYGQLWARLASSAHSFFAIAEQDWMLPTPSSWSLRREYKLVLTPGSEIALGRSSGARA